MLCTFQFVYKRSKIRSFVKKFVISCSNKLKFIATKNVGLLLGVAEFEEGSKRFKKIFKKILNLFGLALY